MRRSGRLGRRDGRGRRGPGLALVALAIALAGLAGACAGTASTPAAGTLTVLAAASLRDPLEAVDAALRADANLDLDVATDASTALRVQIEQGAPADVFLSADTANPDALAALGLTSGVPVVFAHNGLAIVVPRGDPAGLDGPWDLGRPGLRVVAAGEEVPISRYAERLIDNLQGLAGAPAGMAGAYAANVVSREDNVRSVLAKVELGEADAGVVYATDAAASDLVEAIPIPQEADVEVAYAGVVIAASDRQALGVRFLEWLRGPAGQGILERFGFRRVR